MDLVYSRLELVEQFSLFTLHIHELLQAHLVLPFNVLKDSVLLHDIMLGLLKTAHDGVVFHLLFGKLLEFLTSFL